MRTVGAWAGWTPAAWAAVFAAVVLLSATSLYVHSLSARSDLVIIDGEHYCSVGKVGYLMFGGVTFRDRRTQSVFRAESATVIVGASECEL